MTDSDSYNSGGCGPPAISKRAFEHDVHYGARRGVSCSPHRFGRGHYYGWLHVDAATLTEHAVKAGWKGEVVCRLDSGDYLARLTGGRTDS